MAVLTPQELSDHRQQLYQFVAENARNFSKPQLHAAFQAVEDRFEAVRASFGTAIETAAPGVFTAPQKAQIVKAWLEIKFRRGG